MGVDGRRDVGRALLTRIAAAAALWLVLGPSGAAAAPCPDRAAELERLEQAVATADFGSVNERLDDVVDAMSCGKVATPDQLSDLWNGEGAYLALSGESVAAIDSFQAARRVAPGRWNDTYGGGLKKAWEAAPEAASSGTIDVDPRPRWWSVFVDGAPVADLPVDAPTGLHLVQLGPSADDIRSAKVVFLRPGSTAVAALEDDEGPKPAPAPPPTVATTPTEEAEDFSDLPLLSTSVAAGAAVALGRAEGASSAAQLSTPIETGLIARFGAPFARIGVHAAPRLGSRWVYDDAKGPTTTPTGLGFHGAGGAHTSQGDVGLLLGYQWPGRAVVRILYAAPLGDGPLQLEGRLGTNIGRGAEPAVEVLFAYRPALLR